MVCVIEIKENTAPKGQRGEDSEQLKSILLSCHTDGNNRSIYEKHSTILSLPTITIYVHFVPRMSPHYLVFIEIKEKKHSVLSLNKRKVSQRLPLSSGL